ncbi:MAG: SPFH domain-containing protein [Propionibacteriaceae bacterium]|jgi:regulator of protease activity HflC (stomatin/prohibitin superfamily)|nr:SPFH domain-containing protein [Propionibacteriaceae bacterium]
MSTVIPSQKSVAADPTVASTYGRSAGTTITEKSAPSIPGLLGLLILLLILAYGVYAFVRGVIDVNDNGTGAANIIIGIVLIVVASLFQSAFTIVQPGDTKVVQFFGSYVGTLRSTGLRMTYPFTSKRLVSVKVRNFETREIKVNDSQGNPVVIGAIIVWQVRDTAQSVFQVESYEKFVHVQAEAALRHIATVHPYDNGEEGEATLRGATDQVADELAREVAERVAVAGVDIIETRISSLSYAPEIASAMLQRQQAQAVLAARAKIVEGAVTMVESALSRIEREDIVTLDDDRKAAMVSNLLVVLCSDSRAMPTVNTGA